ncbi:hypothetical protein [Reinekea sp. G2M2-21]|uniref:hypothetical protein n=1 Tax=Reinekea sp. G2M2-21 TaxID=2788942 RepID=UPI0018AC8BCF|nr:hypothetical protein [Reinekea sp. G2M2-21]
MKATRIDTELGNIILETLVKSKGWRVHSQYDQTAFDKGIDFDSYLIEKDGNKLKFEWTNWFEWEIVGDKSTMTQLSQEFEFNLVLG